MSIKRKIWLSLSFIILFVVVLLIMPTGSLWRFLNFVKSGDFLLTIAWTIVCFPFHVIFILIILVGIVALGIFAKKKINKRKNQ